jgi:hypothetical protein
LGREIPDESAYVLHYHPGNIYSQRRLAAIMIIPINQEETNLEILARIAKATARKFDCSLDIDFSEGNRHIEFIGDENNKNLIAAEIEHIFRAERKSE